MIMVKEDKFLTVFEMQCFLIPLGLGIFPE